jgi:hypothetical protein
MLLTSLENGLQKTTWDAAFDRKSRILILQTGTDISGSDRRRIFKATDTVFRRTKPAVHLPYFRAENHVRGVRDIPERCVWRV